jgi:hypothetical protein
LAAANQTRSASTMLTVAIGVPHTAAAAAAMVSNWPLVGASRIS